MRTTRKLPVVALCAAAICLAPVPASAGAASRAPNAAPSPWGRQVLSQKPEWYRSAEARAIADSVLQYQSPEGGFPKNTDLSAVPTADALESLAHDGRANTFDNDATILPIEFLAHMFEATGDAKYKAAFHRGIDYTLEAQYPIGGWPQFYPLRAGYYSHITFNDDAMAKIVSFLMRVGAAKAPFAFLDGARRSAAATAAQRGVDLILKLQIVQDGKPAVWCAQYDEKTLQPTWARKYEPPSLSGGESVGIVRLLMSIDKPSTEVIRAVEGAVAWLAANAIHGSRFERFVDSSGEKDGRIVPDSTAGPLWARFYELGTNRPIFLGRASVFRYDFTEIEKERRGGYGFYGTWADQMLKADYPAWKRRIARP